MPGSECQSLESSSRNLEFMIYFFNAEAERDQYEATKKKKLASQNLKPEAYRLELFANYLFCRFARADRF